MFILIRFPYTRHGALLNKRGDFSFPNIVSLLVRELKTDYNFITDP